MHPEIPAAKPRPTSNLIPLRILLRILQSNLMAIALMPCDTPASAERFLESVWDQCVEGPSSLLPVANRSAAIKTASMTEMTKNGEVMFMAQAPCR
jgi:molybdopterin-guanine dinucleotide biosynthesis protein A